MDEKLTIAFNVMPKDLRDWLQPMRSKILEHLEAGQVENAKNVVLLASIPAQYSEDQKQFADIIEHIANG